MRVGWRLAVAVVLLSLAGVSGAEAQYFGRNKIQYQTFAFQILKTDHFDLYYYPQESEAARIASRLAERWYARLSRFFDHQLRGRQVVILYASSAQFRQTNAVDELIGEGTGGLTEALKRRIVLPMAGTLAETDHVLGHELVHAFQFDITGVDPREAATEAPEILQYPLWFVEGMAEYITLGAVDEQTSMWMRDAAMHETLPNIRDLDKVTYFPYRWGHAFWAYIGGKYGDRMVASLLRAGANPRTDLAGLALQLGTDPDALTADWHAAIRKATAATAADAPALASDPRLIVSKETGGGRYNVGPRLSPDGREMAFFSERGRFAVDLFVADASTGKILHRLSSSATDPHFDSLEFLNSAGAWSPDSRTLAVGAIRQGHPVIALLDAQSGSVRKELPLTGLDDVLNPSYAPDGRSIVFSGNRGGLMDLYRIDVTSGATEQLTTDPFADLEPVFSPDGTFIVFVTERFSTNLDTLEAGPLRLARLDLATHNVRLISGFLGGKHLSPQISADGETVTFIADPDGISNLYRMPIDGGPVMRLSSFLTGVAGITASSPALSMAPADGRMVFSVFEHDGHAIYVLEERDTRQTVAPPASRRAALLPGRDAPSGDVQGLISDFARGLPSAGQVTNSVGYGRKLTLDMVSQPMFSVGVTSFGTYVSGSVSAYFSDMLGDRALGVAVQASGTVADIGAQIVYANRQHRWNWAAAAEILPYSTGYLAFLQTVGNQVVVSEVIERQTSRGFVGTASYPLNSVTRFEVGGAARQLSFAEETRTSTYAADTGDLLDRTRTVTPIGTPLYLAEPQVAIVHDTSLFGATSPIVGSRSRFEIGQSLGDLTYSSVLVDVRRYAMPVRPVTIAVRGVHFGRYGRDSENPQLVDFYVGYPELVHGYDLGSFDSRLCGDPAAGGNCVIFNSLRGSRILVGNVEVRAPLMGLLKGQLEYGKVPVEVAGFFDAGVAWSSGSRPAFVGGTRDVIRSAGVAVRANVLGFLTLELSAAHPFDRVGGGVQWQLGIRQGF